MSDNTDISQERWVELFERGFKAGARERKKRPEKRREELDRDIDDAVKTEADLDAFSAGYEEGKSGARPGADIVIEEYARVAYDRSEYSTGLDDFT